MSYPDGCAATPIFVGAIEDIVVARREGREYAALAGFGGNDLTVVATVISELARSVVVGSGSGEVCISRTRSGEQRGLVLEGRSGPGAAAHRRDGPSELVALGRSLAVVRRLSDDFEIAPRPGGGTSVRVTKWMR